MVAARSAAMGFNRLADRDDRRPKPAHGRARAAARRPVARRGVALRRRSRPPCSCSPSGDAEPALPRPVAGGPRDRVRLLVHEALHRRVAPRARPVARRGAGGRVARASAAASTRRRSCWPARSCCGSPASTRSTPARTSSSTAARASTRSRRALGVPRALLAARAHARRLGGRCSLALYRLAPAAPGCTSSGVAGVAALLAWEHTLVRADDLSRVDAGLQPQRLGERGLLRVHGGRASGSAEPTRCFGRVQ